MNARSTAEYTRMKITETTIDPVFGSFLRSRFVCNNDQAAISMPNVPQIYRKFSFKYRKGYVTSENETSLFTMFQAHFNEFGLTMNLKTRKNKPKIELRIKKVMKP